MVYGPPVIIEIGMKPLVLTEIGTGLKVEGSHLIIEDKFKTWRLEFEPYCGKFDTIVITRVLGYITFSAIDWCAMQGIDILFLDAHGHLRSQLPAIGIARQAQSKPDIRLAQMICYLHEPTRLEIAKQLVRDKTGREVPAKVTSHRRLLMFEANQSQQYWGRLGITRQSQDNKGNRNARDPVNAVLNYCFSILEALVRKEIISKGLEPSIGFLHQRFSDAEQSKEPLVYDLEERFRDDFTRFALSLKVTAKDCYYERGDLRLRLKPQFVKRLLQEISVWLEEKIPYEGQMWKRQGIIGDYVFDFGQLLLHQSRMLGHPICLNYQLSL